MFDNRSKTLLAISILLSAALFGCTTTQRITIDPDRSGTIATHIRFHPVLLRYLADLYGLESTLRPIELFDGEAIERSVESEPALSKVTVGEGDEQAIVISMHFDAIGRLLETEGDTPIELTVTGSIETLTLRITPESIRQVLAVSSLDQSVAVATLLPIDGGMNEQEYSDYLGWALEEYVDQERLASILGDSGIEVVIDLPGEIVEQRNGTILDDGDAILFHIPLPRLLTLQSPLLFSVGWRAN